MMLLDPAVSGVPPRSLPDIVSGWLRWAGMTFFVAVPIWLYQGCLALLGATLG